ncbi:antitoxin MazE5 [Ornithinimicrobium sediminis]|uniref:antitoxin MazE5 n=1 Tax=Ornithinimicrobium sediminis TaxID=2904603 RepID=UPI001E30E224|nr:antitoxin MazE5 [Ornithinimicrobium sediminis]MCE0488320.1 antitoxin MazE5 [Ornithinimicrobium sediminis]
MSTTVDGELLSRARQLQPGTSDASMVERALTALLAQHERMEIDAAYARAYEEHPFDEPDEWGDLARFGEAAGAR